MEYKRIDFSSYRLHLVKTKKFKSILVKVNFREKIEKENITKRNVLSDILVYSTKNNKTKRAMNIKCQDLYDTTISAGTTRYGNYLNTSFNLYTLSDRYTEENNFKKALEFLKEIIFEPNVEDGAFDCEALNTIKRLAKTQLESIKEDTNGYSSLRLREIMNKGRPSSYRMVGYLEDLKEITPSNLYTYYKEIFKSNLVDIVIVGNIDFKQMQELVKNEFDFRVFKNIKQNYFLKDDKKPRRKKTIIENANTNQSKLVIGCNLIGLSDYERKYPLTILNIIFGGGPDSKLFKEVREKNSLCYYVNSAVSRLDKALYIKAGISKENMKKATLLIEKTLNSIKKGKFDEIDIENAIRFHDTSVEELEESIGGIAEDYYLQELIKNDPINVRKEKMAMVTKEEIVRVAKKIYINTVYMLEGDSE